jgi:hypothetical protein
VLHVITAQFVIIKEDKMGETCNMHGRGENAYKLLVGKPEGKRPLGRYTSRGRIILKWILNKKGWRDVDRIQPAQNRDRWRTLVNTVMNLQFRQNTRIFLTK